MFGVQIFDSSLETKAQPQSGKNATKTITEKKGSWIFCLEQGTRVRAKPRIRTAKTLADFMLSHEVRILAVEGKNSAAPKNC